MGSCGAHASHHVRPASRGCRPQWRQAQSPHIPPAFSTRDPSNRCTVQTTYLTARPAVVRRYPALPSLLPPLTEYIDNTEPELSANQLAEFLGASHTRKEGILRQARYVARESSPARIRYSDARRSIARFLARKIRDFAILQQAKDQFQGIIDGAARGRRVTDFSLSNAKLSIEAIDPFIGAFNTIELKGLTFTLGEDRPPRISIELVGVSVRPDVIVTSVDGKLRPIVGGILMYFGKNGENEEKINERRTHGLTAATLMHHYAMQHLTPRGMPDRKLCMSLDIFAHCCPVKSGAPAFNGMILNAVWRFSVVSI
jgi:hypothetical protein